VSDVRRIPPPDAVLAGFGATQAPVKFAMGRGQTWAAGALVLKPAGDEREAIWLAELAATLPRRGFRLARPIAARDGHWIVDGWTAWARLDGEHSTTRWPELLAAAAAFHDAVRHVPRPEFIERQGRAMISPLDRWRFADRIAWGEADLGDLAGVAHVAPLLEARRPIEPPSQLIHGDLVGNVLFADGLAPAILDLSLYWRPVGYSAALVVGDALTWEGAPPDTLTLLRPFAEWQQLLLRAVLFRIVVNALARRAEPWRADLSDEYRSIVDLVLRLTP
jgi:uncharacterized protein (TIGR02569 family)